MANNLFLTSLKYINKVPEGTVKLFIAREPIKNMDKYSIKHLPQLAPSEKLLHDYKNLSINWIKFVQLFRSELMLRIELLDYILARLKETDIALICYCPCISDKHCHRNIIGNYFQELDVNIINIGKDFNG